MSFLDSVGSTLKSIGGAVAAPAGVAWDLASAPFDDKDDDFGTLVDKVAGRAGDALDPILNEKTLGGMAFAKTMQSLEWAYREGVSEPLSTTATVTGHVLHNPLDNFEDIFSGRTWGEAYSVAQGRSPGQSAMLAAMNTPLSGALSFNALNQFEGDVPRVDPLDERAWKQTHKNAPFLMSSTSGGVDFMTRWYLDPGVVAGKFAKVAREAKTMRKIKPQDFTGNGIFAKTFEERHGIQQFNPLAADDLGSRTGEYLEFINRGANGAPLNAAQVYVATPELKRSAAGHQIAGLLADAAKLEDDALRRNSQRRILAVAWGDVDELDNVRGELAEMGSVGDALKNIAKGNVVDLKSHAVAPAITANPVLMASMQNQLDNLDDVTKFVDTHVRKLETLIDTGDTLKYAPGVHNAGKRALAREQSQGLLRDGRMVTGPEAVKKPVNWVAERASRLGEHVALSSVYQRSQSHMPLKVITHTAKGIARVGTWDYGRAPMRVADALRTSHLQGFVSTHDWNGATNQLDSMLRLGKVDPGERLNILSRVQMARNEQEKMVAINMVEKATMRALVRKHGVNRDFENTTEVEDFIGAVMEKGQAGRTGHLASMYGRAYAATKNQADNTAGRVDQITPRADLIDPQDGVPVALPLLETQGRNYVPLFDAALADKMLKREYGRLAKHAQAWSHAGREIGRLKALQGATGKSMQAGLEKWHAVQDMAADAASFAMRTWKFSVLFRLGYPLRVIADDHMRIWSQIGGAAIMAPLARETLGNVAYNRVGRGLQVSREVNEARVRLAAVNDMLDGSHVDTFAEKATEVASLNRKIAKARSAGNQERLDTLTMQRDYLHESMGEDPTDLMAEKAQLEAFLDLSRREQKKLQPKRRRGQKELTLGDVTYPGAFGGDMGDAYRVAASSNATFDNLAKVGEERLFKDTAGQGSWRVIHNDDPAHHVAWADVLNNQFRQSEVAMFFLKNSDATVDDFARWVKQPEQRGLRERLPHFSHDAEDWGWRVKQLVDDYAPTQELRDMVVKGRVTPRRLDRMFQDVTQRPAVHGATVSTNLGTDRFATMVGRTMNRLYKFIGEMPTDTLSRHPYFAAMYETEVKALHARRMAAAERSGREFTQADVDDIVSVARRNALQDLKQTLFDISAHSNAAHMMRFVSPFFAAHQESLARWWRIVADDPSVIRRFQMAFDAPRKLGLVVDYETGEPIKEGEMPGPNHSIMLRVPKAWGGKGNTGWVVNENSFNLILQNGILNPGVGPIVQMPVEAVVQQNAQYEDLERVARLLNPYPPQSIGSIALPATVRRVHTLIAKEKSTEYARMYATNLQDKVVDFKLAHGDREPTQSEMAQIERDARNETNTEAWLRLGQNALSPAPASPRSRYEVFRQGWRKIADRAQAEGRDYDWMIDQFKAKYGEAYLPMIASAANNPGDLDATNETVGALKRHRKIIDSVDLRFAGAIIGPAGKYQSADDYSATAAKWLRENTHRYSEDGFYSYDNPVAGVRDAAVKRGWNDYSRAMDVLNVMASRQGLQHYSQSDQLMALKRTMIDSMSEQNIYWGEDYSNFNPGEFDAQLDDLRMIVKDRSLRDRRDVQQVGRYLQLRDLFSELLAKRDREGGSADPGAKSNQDLMGMYRNVVATMAEQVPDFEEYWYNGLLERDPYLDKVYFKTEVN